MRLAHYIRPNEGSEQAQSAIWFDTETDPHPQADGSVVHRLRFGWACHQRQRVNGQWTRPDWYFFTDARDFWEWAGSKCRPGVLTYVFCHNTNFDLPVTDVFNVLPSMGWTLKRAVIDAPPTILVFRRDRASLKILDTLNFWRVPLKKLGESIGAAKLDMPAPDAPQSAWDLYCKQDVEVIRLACHQWWRFLIENDLGGFAPTLAGQAFRTWRHRFMDHQVLVHDHPEALDLARRAYLGGRNECFRHGRIEGPIYYLDINSMYPSVMRGNPYPVRLLGVDTRCPERTYTKYRATHATIAEVLIETGEPLYPRVIDKRLCFPVGRFWCVLAGPELAHAYNCGRIIKWRAVAVYHQANIFDGFIDFFYTERLKAKVEGNEVRAYYLKILLNSLYGKFGQRGMVWEEAKRTHEATSKSWIEYDVETGWVVHFRQLAGLIQAKSAEGEARESVPSIAAYVTSYARMVLYRLITEVGMENAIYCDTDGLFTTVEGYNRVLASLSNTQLGAPKLEHTAEYVTVRGLKDYDLGGRVKVKGVRSKAHWLSQSEILQEQWSGLRGQLSRGALDKATTRPVVKKLSRKYGKGHMQYTGRVAPLRLDEGVS